MNTIVVIDVGNEKAKIITMEKDKRFWYAITPTEDAKVKQIKKNGIIEMVDEIKQLESKYVKGWMRKWYRAIVEIIYTRIGSIE